ncbi:hypothetical protein E2C01_004208 [Portunus trituberculatus]|uniref:Uncharacterized protein n=1 Tax=Portunus trituberculatus TaxID=210409 RepID=A0A5B7CPB5_PORTR|nr:hypothetical protein [Portunus trituberculatus]
MSIKWSNRKQISRLKCVLVLKRLISLLMLSVIYCCCLNRYLITIFNGTVLHMFLLSYLFIIFLYVSSINLFLSARALQLPRSLLSREQRMFQLHSKVFLLPLKSLMAPFNPFSAMTSFHIHPAYYLVILYSLRNLYGD